MSSVKGGSQYNLHVTFDPSAAPPSRALEVLRKLGRHLTLCGIKTAGPPLAELAGAATTALKDAVSSRRDMGPDMVHPCK